MPVTTALAALVLFIVTGLPVLVAATTPAPAAVSVT